LLLYGFDDGLPAAFARVFAPAFGLGFRLPHIHLGDLPKIIILALTFARIWKEGFRYG
jgi:hypothetical protein